MAFNYNVTGLKVDVADALLTREKRLEYQARKKSLEDEAAERKRYQRLWSQREQSLSTNPMADTSQWDSALAGIDPDMFKSAVDLTKKMDDDKLDMMFDRIYETKIHIDNGMVDQAYDNAAQTVQMLNEAGRDSTEATAILEAIQSGDADKMQQALGAGVELGRQLGFIELPESLTNEGTFYDDEGKQYFALKNPQTNEITRQYTEDSRELQTQAEMRKNAARNGVKLSQDHTQMMFDMKKSMLENNDLASSATKLEKAFSKIAAKDDWTEQGLAAAVQDGIENVLGTQDPENFARRAFNGYVNKRVVADRPPGAMSNFEFKALRDGYPGQGANPALLTQYFKEAARASKLSADLDRISGTFIEATGGMFTARKDAVIDGLKIKEGESMVEFENRWLDRENAREGEKKEKEAAKKIDAKTRAREKYGVIL